jgi:hypothetical protein
MGGGGRLEWEEECERIIGVGGGMGGEEEGWGVGCMEEVCQHVSRSVILLLHDIGMTLL